MKKHIKANPEYDRGILDAIQLVADGKGGKRFLVPLNNPTTTRTLQEIILTIFRDEISKQRIKGGVCIQVSCFGYTDQLQIIYNKEGDKASGIKYVECYISPWDIKNFVNFISPNGAIDIERIPENLRKLIAYRVPTIHKYSMLPLYVKGFLPAQNGSCIMLPMEAAVLSGEKCNSGNLFLMIPEFKAPTFVGKNIETFIDDFIAIKKTKKEDICRNDIEIIADKIANDNNTFEESIEKEAYDFFNKNQNKYGHNSIMKVEYDMSKSVSENSRAQRNNMLIGLLYGILTSPTVAEQILYPRNFKNVKKASRISRITNDSGLLNCYKERYSLSDNDGVVKSLLNASVDNLDDFIQRYQKSFNQLDLRTFMHFREQYRINNILLGVYAKTLSFQAKYQDKGLMVHPKCRFKINGKQIDSISPMRAQTGELISLNCAEFFTAALEDNNDSILNDLSQNGQTAYVTSAMLLTGLSIEEIGLMLSQPIVKRVIKTSGNLNYLNNMVTHYINVIKGFDNTYQIPAELSVNSPELLANILNGKLLDDLYDNGDIISNIEEARRDGVVSALSSMVNSALIMWKILITANAIKSLMDISRADSPNGAILPSIAQALNQKRGVELFNRKASKNNFAILNTSGLVKNDIGSQNSTIKELREAMYSAKMPMFQAFYSLGIDMPLPMIANYFPMMKDSILSIFEEVSENTPSGLLPDRKYNTQTYTSEMLLKDITIFALSDTKLFGNDDMNSYEQKRDYYIYEFPRKFIEIMDSNDDLKNMGALKKLVVKQGKIIVENMEKMSTDTINRQMADIDQLLASDNPAAPELLEDLLKYSYYVDQLDYGPRNYIRFFSPIALSSSPEYCQALDEVPVKMSNSIYRQRFLDQLYAQHAAELLPVVTGTLEGNYLKVNIDAVINKAVENTANDDLKKIRKYVGFRTYNSFVRAYVIEPFKFVQKSMEANMALFERMPYFDDIDGVRYNASTSSEEMAKSRTDVRRYANLQCTYGKQNKRSN